ncbi:MAG: TIGR04211 family SH3 domain-containing protein [Gammaproteobacteria bacterium]|nr:TIGR04211 family SH3 domain-containing protein [Gammaproteobacteria bacterium]MDH5650319.1 TIGR04211 family SH3 domain-containing protein [Gammaproteobacteria bacterium]
MKNKKTRIIFITLLSLFIHHSAAAETRYVTDRIMLGVAKDPAPASLLVTSIPTGTMVETSETNGDFTRIKLPDGTEGWVNTVYLRDDKPAVVELTEVKDQLAKKEREVQNWRDEATNRRNEFKELKRKMSAGETVEADPELANKLKEAETRNQTLTEQVAKLDNELQELRKLQQGDSAQRLKQYESENIKMKTRIEAALANLEGKTVPTPEELASIRPDFPLWYTILLVLMVVIGIGGGIGWMDYQNRKRHGGFRL